MKERRPWTRPTIEGLVIVISILLAFGVDALWGARQERARVVAALFNLQAGFDLHRDLTDAELRRIEPFQERVDFFLDADADLTTPPGEHGQVLESLHRPMVSALNSDELIALLDAEALREMDAPGLSAAAARWRGQWRVILDRHDSLYELEDEALRALARLDGSRVVVSSPEPWEEVGESAMREARRDEVLLSLAATKAYHLRVLRQMYGTLGSIADSVLAQIGMELDR